MRPRRDKPFDFVFVRVKFLFIVELAEVDCEFRRVSLGYAIFSLRSAGTDIALIAGVRLIAFVCLFRVRTLRPVDFRDFGRFVLFCEKKSFSI